MAGSRRGGEGGALTGGRGGNGTARGGGERFTGRGGGRFLLGSNEAGEEVGDLVLFWSSTNSFKPVFYVVGERGE